MILDWDHDKRYTIIYADPPWDWKTHSAKGAKKSPTSKYSCMTLPDIGDLPVNEMAEDDALLFCWVTTPLLHAQLDIIKGWGFEYKTTGFVWVKMNRKTPTPFMGLGYYTRANAEMVVIARKGNPPRPSNRGIRQLVMSPIREHSRKPEIIRENIGLMYPNTSKLELFAREEFDGWDCIGNEVGKFTGRTLFD